MAIQKYIIDKSELSALLRGEELAIQPRGNIRGVCVEIAGNVTNGDMVKAMFPNVEVKEVKRGPKLLGYKLCAGEGYQFYYPDWWNAPYNGGLEE